MKNIIILILSIFIFSCSKENEIPTPIQIEKPVVFQGYKVQPFTKDTESNYWRDCGVMWDVIANHYLRRIDGGEIFFPQLIVGDYNKDGWIDVFNPGTGSFNGKPFDNFSWLIWNPNTRSFDKKNLFNNKSFTFFGGNQRKTLSVDLNNDGYTDNIILDHGDDIILNTPREPVRLVISDGKGGYDLKELNISISYDFFHGGDIADLNNDGKLDLVVVGPNKTYICWGNSLPTYFDFAEVHNEMGGQTFNIVISDIDKDGNKDLLFGANGGIKVFYNQGNKMFVKKTEMNFSSSILMGDFRVIDFNNDGLNDIISTGSDNYDDFSMQIYIQTTKYNFTVDNTKFVYTINTNRRSGQYGTSWKPWLILYDFNNDGVKDISYIDPHNYWDKSLRRKSVFIRKGDQFIEEDFYKYDSFCSGIKP